MCHELGGRKERRRGREAGGEQVVKWAGQGREKARLLILLFESSRYHSHRSVWEQIPLSEYDPTSLSCMQPPWHSEDVKSRSGKWELGVCRLRRKGKRGGGLHRGHGHGCSAYFTHSLSVALAPPRGPSVSSFPIQYRKK